jgi:ribosome-associated toxin RatA of RatAB toxin-antitoxin module
LELTETIPSLRNGESDPETLAQIGGGHGELILLHDPKTLQLDNRSVDDCRFVSCSAVIDEPPETVRDFVTNFGDYHTLLKFIRESEVLEDDEDHPAVSFSIGMDTPLVDPRFNYTLRYDLTGDDIVFRAESGDFDTILGRWEFIPLEGDRTFLVYTSWFEFGSLSWTMRTIFWAQPDLKTTIPVTQASVLIHAMKNRLENRSDTPPQDTDDLPEEPSIPILTDDGRSLEALAPLTEQGTLIKVHPHQWINDEGSPLDITFVTAIGLMETDAETARHHSRNFEKYPDYIDQVSTVTPSRDDDGNLIARWELDLGVNILSIGLDYTIKYLSHSEKALKFHRLDGDIEHVYGALEWVEIEEDRTLFFYTTATQVGSGDSFIVQLANILPHKQIIIGVAAGAMAVEKLVNRVNEKQE